MSYVSFEGRVGITKYLLDRGAVRADRCHMSVFALLRTKWTFTVKPVGL